MTKYPNKEALRTAILDIYLDAMRDFIPRSLEKVRGTTSEELISIALECEPDDSKEAIDVPNIPHLIRTYWSDIFNREFTSKRLGGDARRVAWNSTELIVETRNHVVHPNTGEIDSEYTRACLSLIADILDKINASEEKYQVETIRDRLFSNEVEEHPLEAENASYKEKIADLGDQLAEAKAKKTELEVQLETTSDRLEEVEAEWIDLEESRNTLSDQLVEAKTKLLKYKKRLEEWETEQATYEELLGDMWNQVEAAEKEKVELEKNLAASEAERISLKKRLETSSNPPVAMDTEGISSGKEIETEVERGEQTTNRELGIQSPVAPVPPTVKVIKLTEEYLVNEGLVEQTQRGYYRLTTHGFETWGQILPFQPILQLISDRLEYRRADIIEMVAKHFSLTRDERRILSQNVLVEGYLMNKELIERTRTGYYRITDRGVEVLRQNTSRGKSGKTNRVREAHDGYTKPTRVKKIILPTGKEMEQPALEFLSDGREYPRIEIINALTEHFSLTKNQREQLSRSGRVELYLRNKDLIERTRTGYYRITDLGLEVLRQDLP